MKTFVKLFTKQKFILLSALLLCMGMLACEKDSLNLSEGLKPDLADELARDYIGGILALHKDFLKRNPHILNQPDRFHDELTLLSEAVNYNDIKHLVANTAIDLDLYKFQRTFDYAQKMKEGLDDKLFTQKELQSKLDFYSMKINTSSELEPKVVLRSKMECLRSYDETTENILIGLAGCIGAASLKTIPVKARQCSIAALTALTLANVQYQRCLNEQ